MSQYQALTDTQWLEIEPLFPKIIKRGRGKPHTPWRNVANSILMVLLTKEKWSAIPKSDEFATKSASHRWFTIWDKNGFLNDLLNAYKAVCSHEADMVAPPRRNRIPKSEYGHPALPSEESMGPMMGKMSAASQGI